MAQQYNDEWDRQDREFWQGRNRPRHFSEDDQQRWRDRPGRQEAGGPGGRGAGGHGWSEHESGPFRESGRASFYDPDFRTAGSEESPAARYWRQGRGGTRQGARPASGHDTAGYDTGGYDTGGYDTGGYDPGGPGPGGYGRRYGGMSGQESRGRFGRDWPDDEQQYEQRYGAGYGQGYGQGHRSDYSASGDYRGRTGSEDFYAGRDDEMGDRGATSAGMGATGQTGRRSFRGRGPKDYGRTDERLREVICERLTEDHDIDASLLSVDVNNGEVTLTGSVPDRRTKFQAEELIENCGGVTEIHNQLRVDRRRESAVSRTAGATDGESTESSRRRQSGNGRQAASQRQQPAGQPAGRETDS